MSLSLSKSRSLTLTLTLNLLRPRLSPLQSLGRRTFSSSPDNDLTDLSESPSSDPLLRNLEDAIQRILVRRSAPDWLPFVPGASYWVPLPSTSHLPPIANLLHNFANPLSPEQSLSTTTVRGWPSSHFFIQGAHLPSLEPEVETNSAECEASQHSDHELDLPCKTHV
ncbi:uncharacterized protein LOC111457911 isoform X1 [Cucurbita moschata]|uniref:Uncharacterized protein LOC111457911 isoform X1 n=1 Tax=Cucurbita moschata TaxID=3662 RepID=A0A6J1GVQ5_CUCMO|nr:uncharacterized protein LOC111457911 isoform X1 [Cucurbita moschata]